MNVLVNIQITAEPKQNTPANNVNISRQKFVVFLSTQIEIIAKINAGKMNKKPITEIPVLEASSKTFAVKYELKPLVINM